MPNKLQIALTVLSLFAVSATAKEKSCSAELGKKQSDILVAWCINVSPATRPPCNSANACSLITSEIKRGCAFLANDKNRPYYCLLTDKNVPK
jgi:hypothetical protein